MLDAEETGDQTAELKEAKELELSGVKLAEQKNYAEALDMLNNSLKLSPRRPSTFNNRAQIYRFLRNDTGKRNDP